MKWTVITIHTLAEAEDYVCAVLEELGYDGVEIKDSIPLSKEEERAQFIDIPPELDETDKSATISCYIEQNESEPSDLSERLQTIREELEWYRSVVNMGDLTIEVSETEDLDWINNWKKYFKSFRIGEDIVIKPTWETDTELREGDMLVEIDPGTAFGTGSHETTWLCIEALRKYVTDGKTVLDVGCGSGILAIIAKMLGADYCVGIDIDPIAVEVSKDNAVQNHLTVLPCETPEPKSGTVSFFTGDVIGDTAFADCVAKTKYPIVVANILADVIMPLAPVAKAFLEPGGLFICSGIINTREQEVRNALEQSGYTILETAYRKDWVCFVATIA